MMTGPISRECRYGNFVSTYNSYDKIIKSPVSRKVRREKALIMFFFAIFACTPRLGVAPRVQGVAPCDKLIFYERIIIMTGPEAFLSGNP
jgi:hypothetical protein